MNFPCDMILNIQAPPFYLNNNGLLYEGNCLEIMEKMPSNSIDLILTDPPYGINFTNSRNIKIENDSREDAIRIFGQFMKKSARILKPGGCCCVFCFSGGKKPLFPIWIQIMQKHFEYKNTVVWDKQIMGLGSHYRHIYEFILVGKKKGNKCTWNGGRNTTNIIHQKRIIPKSNGHPTPKPIGLMKYFINLHSNVGDIILDPFAGCGPTLQAAIELNRNYIGVEIENQYCRNIAKTIDKLPSS